ncbi:relaxase domain-containing protein [Streptomyces sp. NPDC088261]|uniref:relaxase domain-containing protein n=1 Tax=Streptomyces sp. NPDC088261 TaxID=3365851 RepID=UPI003821E49F
MSSWLTDDAIHLVLESCQDVAQDKTLAWLEESVAQIRWESGGKHREPVRGGLMVAVFRHSESRAAQSKPHLHDHAAVSIRARRPDGTRGNLSADLMLEHIVAAGTLYSLYFMEEASSRPAADRLTVDPPPADCRRAVRPGGRLHRNSKDTRRGSGPTTRWTGRPPTGPARPSARCCVR